MRTEPVECERRPAARQGRSRGRRRAVLIGVGVALATLGGGVSEALSSSGPRPTLTASSTFVVFNQHVRLSGTASTSQVTLLARHFGQSSYRRVASARVRAGRFEFTTVPGIATSYEVGEGTGSVTLSRPVQVYVHLDVLRFSCSVCGPPASTARHELRYSLLVRVPASDDRFIRSEPVYLYVGTSAGKVQTERRVGSAMPHSRGRSTVSVSGSIPVDLPAGWRVRFTACDRSAERRTGVGLPWVHDCGEPRLIRSQFMRYTG